MSRRIFVILFQHRAFQNVQFSERYQKKPRKASKTYTHLFHYLRSAIDGDRYQNFKGFTCIELYTCFFQSRSNFVCLFTFPSAIFTHKYGILNMFSVIVEANKLNIFYQINLVYFIEIFEITNVYGKQTN